MLLFLKIIITHLNVLIVAKCNVNDFLRNIAIAKRNVLIVAKCNVNF